ncbi:hypothetical protein IWX90DRAFT_190814 [Phyllosticta citrichinensis]|uniref:Uncharacterized protein n=1 Tax=Phyllosticta citrichinensis TaxID=1130410 RepID=A0ABR1XX35_9PEZI
MTPRRNATPNTLMSNKKSPALSSVPSNLSGTAPTPFQDKDDRGSSKERSSSSNETAEDAEGSVYGESADGRHEHSNSEEQSDVESEPGRVASISRSPIKYGPNHNGGLPVAGASSQNTAGQSDGHDFGLPVARSSSQDVAGRNDGQNDEEEILLGRDAPQNVRCLPWRTKFRIAKRTLISWDAEMYTHSLLSLLWIMETYDYPIPWQEMAALVNPGATGEAFKQAMVKLRNRRVAEGLRVPPPRPSKDHPRSSCKLELAEMMRTAGMSSEPPVPEYGSGALTTRENPYVAELRASTTQTGAQHSTRNKPRATRQVSQVREELNSRRASYLPTNLQRDSQVDFEDLSVVHSRSFTTALGPYLPAITKNPKPKLIFVAHIGPQKSLLHSTRLDQKLISEVAHNVVNGRFAKPSVPNLVLLIDTVPAEFNTEGLEPYPEELGPEFTMAPNSQQKRKRSIASSGSPLMSPTSPSDKVGPLTAFDLEHPEHSNADDLDHTNHSNRDAVPSCLFPEPREPASVTQCSKKRKIDDTDFGDGIDVAADAEMMFNPAYAVPPGTSFRPPPFVQMSDINMSSRQNLNAGLSYSPTRQPRGHAEDSIGKSMMADTDQAMASVPDMDINASSGTEMDMGMGMGMASVGFNYAEQLGYSQDTGDRFSYEGPYMGACSDLDLTLDSATSEQERALLSSTSEWRSNTSLFEVSSSERRLASLQPVPGGSDYVDFEQLGEKFLVEHPYYKDRGMLNKRTANEPIFVPPSLADEELSRVSSQDDSEDL